MGSIRIAFDAKRYFHNSTGLGNYSRWLIEGLDPEKIQAVLCIANAESSPFRQINAEGFLNKRLPSLWRSKAVVSNLPKAEIKVYHGLSNEIPWGMHKSNIPAVVTIHDLIQKRYPENYRAIDRTIYNLKLAYAQKHAKVVVVPSLQSKKDLMRFYSTPEEKIKVIGIGINTELKPSAQLSNEGNYVLCVSSFTRRKNLIRLIKAFDHNNLRDVPLIIAGRAGEVLPRVQKMANSRPNVQLKINPSNTVLSELYHGSKFCVFPSLFEGYGLPVIEAFQYGKTLALSKISSMPELAGQAADYFDPHDVQSISQSINNLWYSEKHRNHLEAQIAMELRKLDSSSLLKQYEQLYLSLL